MGFRIELINNLIYTRIDNGEVYENTQIFNPGDCAVAELPFESVRFFNKYTNEPIWEGSCSNVDEPANDGTFSDLLSLLVSGSLLVPANTTNLIDAWTDNVDNPAAQTYNLATAMSARTLLSLRAFTDTGTLDVQIKVNGSNLGSPITVNSTATTTALTSTPLAVNDVVTYEVSNITGTPAALQINLAYQLT